MVNQSIGEYIVFNGNLEESEDTRGFQYFKEVKDFDILQVEDGILLFAEDHMEKMKEIDSKLDYFKIINNIYDLIDKNEIENSYIKVLIHEGNSLIFETWTMDRNNIDQGVPIAILDFDWANVHEEILENTFESQVSRILMTNDNFEVIVRDPQGQLIEGARSNLYFIKNGQVIKSDISHNDLSITSKQIENIINEKGIELVEERVYDYQLLEIDGAFISGDSFGIAPIKSIESIGVNSLDNEIIEILIKEYKNLKEDYKEKSHQ